MCLAVPACITEIRAGDPRMGNVDFGGVAREVCLDWVPEARIGDFVLVHVGFAISRVDAEEAERTYGLLRAMGYLEGELGPGPDGAD